MSCRIILDSHGPFYAGNIVQGRLVCSFNGRTKVRGIKIRAYGDEHTEWWGTESYYNHTENKHETRSVLYTGDNSLFGLESMLFGSTSGENHVGPGTFTYPFSFQLPMNLPSTFENEYGYIRYTLKGVVDIPWSADYEDKLHFVLISLIDLNSFPQSSFQPVSQSDEKTVCCWCCAGGEITVDINLNKTAFVPGENIKLYVALTNMSNSNVTGLEAKLRQYIKSTVSVPGHETKHDENILAYDSWSGVGAHGENKYDIELPISTDIIVPNLDRSSLFDVRYDLKIIANISGCHNDIDLRFDLNLGHIQQQGLVTTPPQPQSQQGWTGEQGYPYPGGTAPPSGGYPYPGGNPPTAPTPYSNGPPNYASLDVGGAQASAPPAGFVANPKEKEAFGGANPGFNAPNQEAPPPSYEFVSKMN